jgi:hypothetical protein
MKLHNLRKAKAKALHIALALSVVCWSPPLGFSQETIRVETDQVLVPVLVFDKQRVRAINKDNDRSLFDAVFPGEINAIMSSLMVHGLTAEDFRVFDDNKEQQIQKVTMEQTLWWNMRDNQGYHAEYIGPGGGKWSTAEWGPGVVMDLDAPQHYVISYDVPESREGSCHHVKITVNRPDVIVGARPEYCNTKHSPSDVLSGTSLGLQMEKQLLAFQNTGSASVTANALFSGSSTDAVRAHIALDWPWKLFEGHLETIGVLGMIVTADGRLVTRFSDTAFRDEGISPRGLNIFNGPRPTSHDEHRYETEVSLPVGQYEVHAIVGNGKTFARAEVPLTIAQFHQERFEVSAILVCKQFDDVSVYGKSSALAGAWSAEPNKSYLPLVSNDLEFKPTGNTRFKRGATLYVYFEVYEPLLQGQSVASATVQIQMRIVDLKNGELKSDAQPMNAAPYMKTGSPVIPIGRGIDISKLPAGSYQLSVRATDSVGASTTWRTANFTVN